MFSKRLIFIILFLMLFSAMKSFGAQSLKPMAIVIDTSGSMKHMGEEVKGALVAFIEGLQIGFHVVLVHFNVFSEIIANQNLKREEDKQFLIKKIQALEFKGQKTNFDEAIKGAEAGLFRAGITKNASIVIFSDGISDPSSPKPKINLTTLAKGIFPQRDGYHIYFIKITPHQTSSADYIMDENVVHVEVDITNIQRVLQFIYKESLQQARKPEPTQQQEQIKANPIKAPVLESRSFFSHLSNYRWLFYVLGLLALATLGIKGAIWCYSHYVVKNSLGICIQLYGRDETQRKFWLQENETIQIGPGICSYPVSSKSTASLMLSNRRLYTSPLTKSDNISIRGEKITTWVLLSSGDMVIIDGYLKFIITWEK